MANRDSQFSRDLVAMVQIVFAVVLGEGLTTYGAVITQPFAPANRVALAALAAVYLTTIWSWVDWHQTAQLNPYLVGSRRVAQKYWEEWRIVPDMLIVILYAYLLLTIKPMTKDAAADIHPFLVGYVCVFALYFIAGAMRRFTYGKSASRLPAIVIGGLGFGGILYTYDLLRSHPKAWPYAPVPLNLWTIGAVIALTLGYRFFLRPAVSGWYKRRKQSPVIGVDVDGVLGDQIAGVIKHCGERHGVEFEYGDVSDWHYMVGGCLDIADEIGECLRSEQYVRGMPLHPGARRMLNGLILDARVLIVTARPDYCTESTAEWLRLNRLPNDGVLHIDKEKESLAELDVLIDDYPNNVTAFLDKTNGVALLVDQPWNRERTGLEAYLDQGRLRVIHSLRDVRSTLRAMSAL